MKSDFELKIQETKSRDFEALVWYAYSTYLRSGEKVFEPYFRSLVRMLDYVIYCLMKGSADYEELAKDPYIYDVLGRVLTHLTRHRRLLYNVAEAELGQRPAMSREAYEAYLETLKVAKNASDVIGGARVCLRFLITAARAGIYYFNHRSLREVLLMLVERDYDYNTYMDDFVGSFVGEPDVFEPSLDVVNIVLDVAMRDFPREPVQDKPPIQWVYAATVEEIEKLRLKRVLVDGWLELVLVKSMDRIFAVENFCTHEGGFMSDGVVDSFSVTCIDHLAKFDLRTGRVLTQPHHGLARPLAVFPTKIVDGKIHVGLYAT